MDEFEDEFESDQSVTQGVFIPELPDDHWSKSPSWRKLREPVPDVPTSAPEVAADWKLCAFALSGAHEDLEESR